MAVPILLLLPLDRQKKDGSVTKPSRVQFVLKHLIKAIFLFYSRAEILESFRIFRVFNNYLYITLFP